MILSLVGDRKKAKVYDFRNGTIITASYIPLINSYLVLNRINDDP